MENKTKSTQTKIKSKPNLIENPHEKPNEKTDKSIVATA